VSRRAVPTRELRDEVRLVRDRELRVAVEDHAQERRARAADAEDQERRRGHVTTSVVRRRWPAASSTRTYVPGCFGARTARPFPCATTLDPFRTVHRTSVASVLSGTRRLAPLAAVRDVAGSAR